MSELFVDNSSMNMSGSRDVARFSSDASDDATRRGVVAVGSAVELGSFIPLKPGKKQPSWSRKRVSVNADKTVNRSLLPSRPSAEAAAGDGEFTITSHGLSYFDLD